MGRVWGIFIVFFCTGVFSQTCVELLTLQQKEALQKASASHWYLVKVLTRQIENRNQTVILLGESHIKNTSAHEAGKEVLNQFTNIGVEGANIKKYWNGRFLNFCLKTMHKMIRILSLGYLGQPSTIQTVDALKDKNIITLEKNHKPQWNDHFLSLGVQSCVVLGGEIALEGILNCFVTLPPDIQMGLHYLKAPLLGAATMGILLAFFTDTRDTAMAQSIQKYFEENKQAPPLLVITGAAHTAKILKILQKHFSFKEIEL